VAWRTAPISRHPRRRTCHTWHAWCETREPNEPHILATLHGRCCEREPRARLGRTVGLAACPYAVQAGSGKCARGHVPVLERDGETPPGGSRLRALDCHRPRYTLPRCQSATARPWCDRANNGLWHWHVRNAGRASRSNLSGSGLFLVIDPCVADFFFRAVSPGTTAGCRARGVAASGTARGAPADWPVSRWPPRFVGTRGVCT
jgi:hypothetical protein